MGLFAKSKKEVQAPAGGDVSNKVTGTHAPATNTKASVLMDRPSSKRLMVISTNLKDTDVLAKAVNSNVALIVYDHTSATLESLYNRIEAVVPGGEVDSIGFIDHGGPGGFHLMQGLFINKANLDGLPGLRGFLRQVGTLVKPRDRGGRIDFLACGVTGSPEGVALLDELEKITNRNCAASDDKTGDGGDWILESDGVDVTNIYFVPEMLKKWKQSAGTWEQTGALAASGATIGSACGGPAGALVGTAVGGITGWFC